VSAAQIIVILRAASRAIGNSIAPREITRGSLSRLAHIVVIVSRPLRIQLTGVGVLILAVAVLSRASKHV
jgi:hypothetical protein